MSNTNLPAIIEITPEPIEPGATYEGRTSPSKQHAYLHQDQHYPMPFKLNVDDNAGPHKPGFYMLAGKCFQPGQYGLDFRGKQIRLIPMADAVAALGKHPAVTKSDAK